MKEYRSRNKERINEQCKIRSKIYYNENNEWIFGWEIDHIIPISSAKNKEEMISLCHYTNLQPLWHIDNMIKGNKIIKEK
jgi:hypothetical protein